MLSGPGFEFHEHLVNQAIFMDKKVYLKGRMCSIKVHHIYILKGTFNYKDETTGASSLLNDPIRFQFPSRDFSGEVFFW